MNLQNLDITLSRISHIESKIGSIDQKFERLLGNSDANIKSFDNFDKILEKKIETTNNIQITDNKEKAKTSTQSNVDRKEINQLIEKYSRKNGLDSDLVNAVIKTESAFNNKAVSSAGAQGLMQLMPSTAKEMGVDDPFDPEQNISGGAKYLKNLINRYDSVKLGLAAYNAGPESVNKYKGIPPYNETQNYVQKIMQLQGN